MEVWWSPYDLPRTSIRGFVQRGSWNGCFSGLGRQNGALGRALLGKEEGGASRTFPEKSPSGFVSMATNAALKVAMCLLLYNTMTLSKQKVTECSNIRFTANMARI